MANAHKTNKELQADLDQLKKEFGELVSVLKESKNEAKNAIFEKSMSDHQENIQEKLSDAYEIGHENMKSVEQKVKKNPIASMLVAFGTGYLISKVMSKD